MKYEAQPSYSTDEWHVGSRWFDNRYEAEAYARRMNEEDERNERQRQSSSCSPSYSGGSSGGSLPRSSGGGGSNRREPANVINYEPIIADKVGSLSRACSLYKAGRYVEAVDIFGVLCNYAFRDAMGYLGLCYENGQGLAKSMRDAIYWYQSGANMMDGLSCCLLGYCYRDGKGVPKSMERALDYFTDSFAAECGLGAYELGYCHEFAQGVGKDLAAAQYYDSAIFHGYPQAREALDRVRSKKARGER